MGRAGVEGEASESVVGVVAGLVRDIATTQGVGAAAGGALSGGVVGVICIARVKGCFVHVNAEAPRKTVIIQMLAKNLTSFVHFS